MSRFFSESTKNLDSKFFVFCNDGGLMDRRELLRDVPALACRIQDRVPENHLDLCPHGAFDKMRRFYLEIGHASFLWVAKAALELSGLSRLLFGTNCPVESHEVTTRYIPSLDLSPDVLYALDRGNVECLFPQHKA